MENREKKPVAIVLGGTVPHKFLIENLKNRGYYTILIDYYDCPPAADVADRHIQESTLDQEAVLRVAKVEKAALVISGCVDQANVTACYVAEKLGLPAPYTYETALRVTDKMLMKEGMVKAGVPTAEYQVLTADDISHFQCARFPKVVKPSDCNGSKGVRKVTNQVELKEALELACELSRTHKAIVEDFNEGFEISAYYFVTNNEVKEIYAKSRKLPHNHPLSSMQSFMTLGPEKLQSVVSEKLLESAKKIASEFNLINTPLILQANIHDEEFKIIEFMPRVSGGFAFKEIDYQTRFNMLDAVIDSYLNIAVDTSCVENPTASIAIVHLFGLNGILDRVEGLDKLIEQGAIEEYHMHKTPGMPMSSDDLAARNRVLGVIIKGQNMEEVQNKIGYTIKNLKIITKDEIDVLNRTALNIQN